MKKLLTGLAALTALSSPLQGWADNLNTMQDKFRQTPTEQPIAVYWYWIAGNISEEGVVKDLVFDNADIWAAAVASENF